MPNISMPDLIALKATVGEDEGVWGNKFNEITDSIQATLESIITDLNFVTGLNSTWKVEAYSAYAEFPLVGEPLVIYYAIDTQLSYQWDGLYIQVGMGDSSGVVSVNNRTGAIILTKADVGLGNVDNTSDANKPVSTATQTTLNLLYSSSLIENSFPFLSFPINPVEPSKSIDVLTDTIVVLECKYNVVRVIVSIAVNINSFNFILFVLLNFIIFIIYNYHPIFFICVILIILTIIISNSMQFFLAIFTKELYSCDFK